jgi:hypothetical protein
MFAEQPLMAVADDVYSQDQACRALKQLQSLGDCIRPNMVMPVALGCSL